MKKRALLITLCCFALSFLLAPQGVKAGGTSYVMVCRGGGDMSFSFYQTGRVPLTIGAKGGTVGASQRPPEPGECTWVDRGMREGEECVPSTRYLQLKIDADVVGPKPYINEIVFQYGRMKIWYRNKKIGDLIDAITNGKIFYLRARRKAPHKFEVTKIGP